MKNIDSYFKTLDDKHFLNILNQYNASPTYTEITKNNFLNTLKLIFLYQVTPEEAKERDNKGRIHNYKPSNFRIIYGGCFVVSFDTYYEPYAGPSFNTYSIEGHLLDILVIYNTNNSTRLMFVFSNEKGTFRLITGLTSVISLDILNSLLNTPSYNNIAITIEKVDDNNKIRVFHKGKIIYWFFKNNEIPKWNQYLSNSDERRFFIFKLFYLVNKRKFSLGYKLK